MYTSVDKKGFPNNYAPKVAVYCAEYPNQEQQRRYAIQEAITFLCVSFLVLTTLAVR